MRASDQTARSVRWTEVFEGIEAEAFRELALLAREVSRAPIALVTLVDEERHWFTSVTGAQLTEGPWEGTFCSHAVQQTNVFVVPDAARDHRFARNPLVCAPPHIRFYAGAPLVAGEGVLGTLCVMDVQPRKLPRQSAASLRALARQVVMQLELRRQTRQLARLNGALEAEVLERQRTEERLRESENALRESQEDLQRNDAERRELVANISHDLRTPLTALQTYLDTVLLKGHMLDAVVHRQYLERAATLSRRLARLVSDLFELVQLDGNHVDLKRERFELAELTRDVVQSFALGAKSKRITLSVQAVGRPTIAEGDVRLIERALENLLDNALRFTPEGGTVSVTCKRSGDRVVVRVKDTGPGIAAADQEWIFDRFYRGRQPVDGASTTTGLGLSIARRIVELHHGEITAAQGSDGGAELTFSFAACDPATS